MQTFSDFINKRFGYNENVNMDSHASHHKVNKNLYDLQSIIAKITNNPSYQEEFIELIRNFVNLKKEDTQLQQMFSQFENNVDIANINPDRGLATFDGEANKPNNLSNNMVN